MQTTMMNTPLSLNHLLERAGQIFTATTSSRACPTRASSATATPSTSAEPARWRRLCLIWGYKKESAWPPCAGTTTPT